MGKSIRLIRVKSYVFNFQVPTLSEYISFCANQVFGKALLDEKKNDPAVDDFLQRCQDSPFSRKLDLWGLLGRLFWLVAELP